jgi:hypothetical protein
MRAQIWYTITKLWALPPGKEQPMKLCIRAHDLGVTGTEHILQSIDAYGIDGVQMVCYKAYEDVPQLPGAITAQKAASIGKAFADAGKAHRTMPKARRKQSIPSAFR